MGQESGPSRRETIGSLPCCGSGRGEDTRANLAIGFGTNTFEPKTGTTGCSLGTSRVLMGHTRTCACSAPQVCQFVDTPKSRAQPIRTTRSGNHTSKPVWAYVWRTICGDDATCCACGRSKTAAVRSVSNASHNQPDGTAIISCGARIAVLTVPKTACCFIRTVMPKSIAKD